MIKIKNNIIALKFVSVLIIVSSLVFPRILSNIANDIDKLLDRDLTYILYDTDFYATVDNPYNYFEYELYYKKENGIYNEGGEWVVAYEIKNRYMSRIETQPLLNYIESVVDCYPYLSTTYSTTDVKIEKIDDKIYRLYTNCKYSGIGLIIEKNTLRNNFKPRYPANLSIENIKFMVDSKEQQTIYADEEGELNFDIINNGKGNANLTKVAVYDVDSAIGCVIYSEYIISLSGNGGKHHISVPIKTINSSIKDNQLNIENDTLSLYIHAFEYNGFDANSKKINIEYQNQPVCDLKIKAIHIDDDKEGSSWGNDNKIIDPGEAVEITLYIINNGEAPAKNINAMVNPIDNKRKIFINNIEFLKKELNPGEMVELSFNLITTNRTGYSAPIKLDLEHSNFNILGTKNTEFDLKFVLNQNLDFPFKIIADSPSKKFIEKINGIYDLGEKFVDTPNGQWDEGEEFVDTPNGKFDKGDIFIPDEDDYNDNGVWDKGEEYIDSNGNGWWDQGEKFTDSNGNGYFDEEEYFEDIVGNGVWDKGEEYIDIGNGVYDEGEEFIDTNLEDWEDNKYYDDGEMWEWTEITQNETPEAPKAAMFIPFDQPPKARSGIKLKYPAMAKAAGIEGTVVLEFFINKKGRVEEVAIIESAGSPLNEAAISAVKKSTWRPAMQDGKKVGVWIKQSLKFSLE